VSTFLFDLDDTLYSRELGVVARIDGRINEYMTDRLGVPPAEVDAKRHRLWLEHGTTLRGLMTHHRIDPDDYLDYVHDLDLSDLLGADPLLRAVLDRLPGRREVFSNSSRGHAKKVLDLLGIRDCFEAVITLEDLEYLPKPLPEAYTRALVRFGAVAEQCLFVEDTLKNLAPARRIGMCTVWIGDPSARDEAAEFVIETVHEIERVVERRR
jgi:putative hydrolase of the HAD superfamily